MKLPNKTNPVHCASKDGTRYILNSVSIQGDVAVATDGRSLFAVKGCREDDDDQRDAIIPKRLASAAWPQGKGKRGFILPMLTINPVTEGFATCTVTNTDMDRTTARDIEGNFPNVEKVIPDASQYKQRVGLNVKLLLQIAKCFGEDEIAIHFDSDGWRDGQGDKPMLITSKGRDAFGILMPLRTNGDGLDKNEALNAIARRIQQREDAERHAREKAIAEAEARVAAERAEAEARAEADREKTEAWLASNETTNTTEQ